MNSAGIVPTWWVYMALRKSRATYEVFQWPFNGPEWTMSLLQAWMKSVLQYLSCIRGSSQAPNSNGQIALNEGWQHKENESW